MKVKKFKYSLNEPIKEDIQKFIYKVKVIAVHVGVDGNGNLYMNVHYERKEV